MPSLIPSDENGKAVEVDETTALMNKTKKELVDIIQAEQLKYKKLKTQKGNQKAELDEVLTNATTLANELATAKEEAELANHEAATLSETLRIKNQKEKAIENIVIDYMVQSEIQRNMVIQALAAHGLYIEGV